MPLLEPIGYDPTSPMYLQKIEDPGLLPEVRFGLEAPGVWLDPVAASKVAAAAPASGQVSALAWLRAPGLLGVRRWVWLAAAAVAGAAMWRRR